MKIARLLEFSAVTAAILGLSLTAGRYVIVQHEVQASGVAVASAPSTIPLGLPTIAAAQSVLNAALIDHHPQWVDVPMGAVKIRTFVAYPNRQGTAPVVVVKAGNQGMSDWSRAVGIEVMNQGLIGVVPDLLSGSGPNGGGTDSFANPQAVASAFAQMTSKEVQRRLSAVRDYFLGLPSANGKSAILDFDWKDGQLDAVISTPKQQRIVKLELNEHAWHNALPLLASLVEPAMPQAQSAAPDASKDPYAIADAQQRAAQKEIAQRKGIVAFMWNAKHTLDLSPRKGEWVDIPIVSKREGPIKVRAWYVEPLGTDKTAVVVVIHPTPGMDLGENPNKGEGANWMRATADSIAAAGFIAIVPDMTSGLGPSGGNFDSFLFPDDVSKAVASRSPAERMQIITAARDFALTLPRANGKSGAIGFCLGGGIAWQGAADMPGLNVAISFYGTPPDLATMERIHAPVFAFDGDADLGTFSRMVAAAPDMKRLGKQFEYKVYPGATHAFLYQQQLAQNAPATLDSWPKSMAIFKRYLSAD
jgi:carboxymethylenebutenolidase